MSPISPLFRLAISMASPGRFRGKLTILTYHRVLAARDVLLPGDQIDVRCFAMHMQALASHFTVLPLPEAVDMLYANRLPSRAACITFDDGYADNYTEALPILKAHGFSATFFVCSQYLGHGLMFNDLVNESIRRSPFQSVDLSLMGLGTVSLADEQAKRSTSAALVKHIKYLSADDRDLACEQLKTVLAPGQALPQLMMSPDQLRGLSQIGMTIGGHTHTHPILTRVSLDSARADTQRNMDTIKSITGKSPSVFAYPNGIPDVDYDARHVAMLRELGFRAAVSSAYGVAHTRSDPLQLPRFAPWGNDPRPFVLRLIRNALLGQHAATARLDPKEAI
jgi:peptidoglycan/xylan/chitin deacetylase (PgdA/CDA1 family)